MTGVLHFSTIALVGRKVVLMQKLMLGNAAALQHSRFGSPGAGEFLIPSWACCWASFRIFSSTENDEGSQLTFGGCSEHAGHTLLSL